MTTVAVDIAAITPDATEIALALTRGTNVVELQAIAALQVKELNTALANWKAISSTNAAAITTIQAKLLP